MGIGRTQELGKESLPKPGSHTEQLLRTIDGKDQVLQLRIDSTDDDNVPLVAIDQDEKKVALTADEMLRICMTSNTRIPDSLRQEAQRNPNKIMPIPSNTPQDK